MPNLLQNNKQLDMALPRKKGEKWLKIKNHFENFEKGFELTPFWKYGLNIFSLVTIILFGLILFYVSIYHYPNLPEQIPLVYNQSSEIWDMFPKYSILLMVLIFFLGLLGNFILSYYIYFFDKRLSIIINLISIVVVYLFLTGITQILSFELL
ncbi:hypothetical protein KBD45_01640 [Candidatus Dojkabacteria bacterium]|nr:hypothetical protein [Candidatus Dojkabacteria bacterium]